MSPLGIVLLVVLLVVFLGVFPRWNHSRSWGYGPSSAIGILLIVLVVMLLVGYI